MSNSITRRHSKNTADTPIIDVNAMSNSFTMLMIYHGVGNVSPKLGSTVDKSTTNHYKSSE